MMNVAALAFLLAATYKIDTVDIPITSPFLFLVFFRFAMWATHVIVPL